MSAFRGKAARVKIEQYQDEEQEGCAHPDSSLNAALSLESTHPLRSLAGRPMRKAAEAVVSYKEIPLNIKIRRSA
ncbi:hypothetical protein SUGI_1068050 [Cryptomeria japonica]|nr:hypothetical protein SUGI_1068050 [Cryptomeria japonica]